MKLISLLLLSLLAYPSYAAQVYLDTKPKHTEVGEVHEMMIRAKDMPKVYAMELILSYPQDKIKILDENKKKAGVQMTHGEFIQGKDIFVFSNATDAKKGIAKYITSLLKPALDAEGDGLLFKFRYQIIQAGDISFKIDKAEFGTKTGELVVPDKLDLSLTAERAPQVEELETGTSNDILILALVTLVAVLLLVMGLLVFVLQKQRSIVS